MQQHSGFIAVFMLLANAEGNGCRNFVIKACWRQLQRRTRVL